MKNKLQQLQQGYMTLLDRKGRGFECRMTCRMKYKINCNKVKMVLTFFFVLF